MELDSRKKSRRDRMMRLKSFDTNEVRQIGWKEAGESRGFPILWIGIIEDVFQMEGKGCKIQERLKKKIHARARRDWRQPQERPFVRTNCHLQIRFPRSRCIFSFLVTTAWMDSSC